MMQTVRVPLAANTLYVSGTVNGVDKVWTRDEGNVWWTTAERSDDGVYRIALTIIYGDGKTTEDSITLYYGLHLITDRTQADVDRVRYLAQRIDAGIATLEELAEWNTAALKGGYNYTDLNRVGAALRFLSDRLADYGYYVPVTAKQDWTEQSLQSDPNISYYLRDVETIRAALAVMPTTPATPVDIRKLTYQDANSIEQILLDVDFLITQMTQAWFYAGEIYSGEVM